MTKAEQKELHHIADCFVEFESEINDGSSPRTKAEDRDLLIRVRRVALEKFTADRWDSALAYAAAEKGIIRPLESPEDFTSNMMNQLDALVSKGAQS